TQRQPMRDFPLPLYFPPFALLRVGHPRRSFYNGTTPMRVIAGKFRSRKLNAPPGMDTRPTSDRLRETLFNVVGPRVPDSVWLDLYAGTGAVGIEAISRGARQVYFVESEKKAARIIRDN